MRINTGKYKGRIINTPKGIRPTQDKVRKALFDILGDIEGLSFLELFAGSGAVGFEAVSRGALELILVEYSRDCQLAIEKNIESLKSNNCSLYHLEVDRAIQAFCREKRRFDIIFLDPPYHKGDTSRLHLGQREARSESLTKKTLQTLEAYDILAPDGLVIAQHFKKEELQQEFASLSLVKQAKYGDTLLSFYRKA